MKTQTSSKQFFILMLVPFFLIQVRITDAQEFIGSQLAILSDNYTSVNVHKRLNKASRSGINSVAEHAEATEKCEIYIFPNPAVNETKLYCTRIPDSDLIVEFYDHTGECSSVINIRKPSDKIIPVNLGSFEQGLYQLKIIAGGKTIEQQLTVLK